MKTCEDIHGRLWAFLDDELDAGERAEVADHLERCAGCARDAERARELLETLRASGRETAPPGLVARVEAILDGAEGADAVEAREAPGNGTNPAHGATPSGRTRRPRRRWWATLAPLAAILAALLIARPWAGDRAEVVAAPGFAADHVAHAEAWPSAQPFQPGERVSPAPPTIPGGRVAGLSRCVVEGRTYAHWTFDVDGGRVSAFVPIEGRLLDSIDPLAVDGVAVATVEGGGRVMVLVSTDLGPEALAALSPGA